MARPKTYTDPVDGANEAQELEKEMESFDLSKVKVQAIPPEAAKASRPFDGYPLKYAGKGKDRLCLTHLVGYNHLAKPLRQDPSNKLKKNGDGKMVKILTTHNRLIKDPETKENLDVVFDRLKRTADGEFYFAIVPSPYVRAQLCFAYDNKLQRIIVDTRYLLLDLDQKDRLKRCFEQVINPQLKIERDAEFISGKSTEAPSEYQEEPVIE